MKLYYLISYFLYLFSFSTNAQGTSISEEKFISIGGIEQWITIKGEDRSKPVILFLHGGPGSTMSQYQDTVYGYWKEDFILVQWDQRGAGRTFGPTAPLELSEDYLIKNPLTVEQMTNDGIELSQYLIKYLGKKKIILIGTSWGSILGIKMASKNPDIFYAYIGHSQFVNFSKNIDYAYLKVLEMARNAQDEESIKKLETLGKPPFDRARNTGQFLRIVKKYERENSVPAPDNWWKLAPEYDNAKDSSHRYTGDDYSFINLVGDDKLSIKSMVAEIDFNSDNLIFNIPIYLVQGDQDILTSKELNKPYFDKIKAPNKNYFLLDGAGHGHNQAVVDTQYKIVKEYISPLIQE
tara:strand:+ start:162 stop:1214 length:1053 start_codon:yes stop_codon:yes gene_type:complete